MKIAITGAVVGAISLATSAHAGFMGFVASVRTSGAYTLVDVWAGVSNATDRLMNVYDLTGSTSAAGGFYQQAGLATKTWRPDGTTYTSNRSAIDSFMTIGGTDYLLPQGVYAEVNTVADPNWTGTSWNATPSSAAANSIPALAGWYLADPTNPANQTESLAGIAGRVNSGATAASGSTAGTVGGASANFGIWCAHLVLSGNYSAANITSVLTWTASATIKDGMTGASSQGVSTLPAPGAVALLAMAGTRSRRRR
jgi:hypothetical protein